MIVPETAQSPSPLPRSNHSGSGSSWWLRLLREPLLHFLLLGAILFGLYGVVNGTNLRLSSPGQIEISAPAIALLRNDWQRQWGHEPSPEELQSRVDQYIRDEVFYREAQALGLDQNDLIVRQRLIQKMEFLVEDVSALREPTDDDLQAYLADHADRYRVPGRISFAQIYFSRELRGDRADADAQTVLNQLQANPSLAKSKKVLGDRTMLPATYTLASSQQIANGFGATLAQELATVTKQGWQGPFHSVYGTHLVNVTALEPGHAGILAEVRGVVRLDWLNEQRQQQQDAAYQQLRDRYRIEFTPEARDQLTVQPISKLEAG